MNCHKLCKKRKKITENFPEFKQLVKQFAYKTGVYIYIHALILDCFYVVAMQNDGK